MRLNYTPFVTKEERALLRPKVGDIVIYEGTKYIVRQVGSKYYNCEKIDKPGTTYMLKSTDAFKYIEPTAEQEERGPKADDIAFDFLR